MVAKPSRSTFLDVVCTQANFGKEQPLAFFFLFTLVRISCVCFLVVMLNPGSYITLHEICICF